MKNKSKKQLEAEPSIKDLKIAEQLKRLRDFNQERVDDNDDDAKSDVGSFGRNPLSPQPPPPFDLQLYQPPSPLISEEENGKIEKDLTPVQKFLLGETTKAPPLVAREKVAVAEKVRLSGNLNKLFPKGDAVLENDDQKPFDDEEPLHRPEMTIPQTQVIYVQRAERWKVTRTIEVLLGCKQQRQ